MEMSNKQVITIFAVGIGLLLIAFWAGVKVDRGRTTTNAGQLQVPAPVTEPVRAAGAQPGSTETADSDPDTRYMVVVAAFGTEEKANELREALRRKRYISAHTQRSGDKLFNVLIGPYDKREAAEQVANDLVAEGRKGIKVEAIRNNRDAGSN